MPDKTYSLIIRISWI